ncbi:MAG TPA: MOSC N-terminal beta barrel domain-containing protein [Gemmatimonadales bacterium]|nr:MOSC N-terminal beta barrel domain-containing protein [Gemmatimonadales bacterium]
MIRVTGLFRYPIKSCAGISLDSALLDHRGIEYDRRWMVVDAMGVFRTQRELPRMALIHPRISGEGLTLMADGMPDLSIPLTSHGSRLTVGVWNDEVRAIDQGEAVAEWLTRFLAEPLRLVRFDDTEDRRVEEAFAVRPGDQVGFADAYPLLIGNEASLADLNTRLAEVVPMKRFRPNIVVTGAEPYAEDRWGRIRVGEVEVAVVKPCARCAITTVNPETAEKGKEPLAMLAKFRRAEGGVMFCENAIHLELGTLRVGDTVTVEAARETVFPFITSQPA